MAIKESKSNNLEFNSEVQNSQATAEPQLFSPVALFFPRVLTVGSTPKIVFDLVWTNTNEPRCVKEITLIIDAAGNGSILVEIGTSGQSDESDDWQKKQINLHKEFIFELKALSIEPGQTTDKTVVFPSLEEPYHNFLIITADVSIMYQYLNKVIGVIIDFEGSFDAATTKAIEDFFPTPIAANSLSM